MLDPFDHDNRLLGARLGRARLRTFLSVMLERVTASSWRLMTWCGFFGGLWLFQVQTFFGHAGGIIALLIFLGGIIYFFWKDAREFRWPQPHEIDRRIEIESKVKHRPLTALEDSLANPHRSTTRKLWLDARERVVEALKLLRAGKPRAFMASRDPHAVRLGVLLFLGLGLYAAGPAWDSRLLQGLLPMSFEQNNETLDKLALWITPPAYTGIAPIIVKGKGDGKVIAVPANSTLKIIVRSGTSLPHLIAGKDVNIPFKKAEDGNYMLETPLPAGDTIKIRQGFFTRATWHYSILPDTPPQIYVKGVIEMTPDGPMRVPLEVTDDYGVKNVTMNVTLNQSMNPVPLGDDVHETRVVMSPPKTTMQLQPVYDLTSHPWAGEPVSVTFTAEDGGGQKVTTAPIAMTLPERPFKQPVARRLIAIRKKLILGPTQDFKPMAQALELVLIRPGLYLDDHIVFLAIRAAASHLYWADPPSAEDSRNVVSLLWDTALRVEGSESSIAAKNLRDAQRDLEKALDNPEMSQEQIDQLMSNLRSAMAEYFTEMQREMQKRMAEGEEFPTLPPEMMKNMIDPEALGNFLQQLEARMKAGDKKGAAEMMAQLQRLMDMMDPSMAGPMPEDMQMMNDGIAKLQDLIKRQRQLLDQTQSQLNTMDAMRDTTQSFGEQVPAQDHYPKNWDMDNMPPAPDKPKEAPSVILNTSPHKEEQEALRSILDALMQEAGEKLNKMPENMGQAELEMRGSSAALGENDPAASIPHQQAALDQLQKAQQQLSQQLAQRMQQMTGLSMMGGGMKFDPLGRPYGGDGGRNGMFPGSPVKIPDAGERKKALEILDLLRRRSGELERPDEELDYYKRLLRQF